MKGDVREMQKKSKSEEKTERSKAFVRDYPYLEKKMIEMLKEGKSAIEIREELLKYVGEE